MESTLALIDAFVRNEDSGAFEKYLIPTLCSRFVFTVVAKF